MEDHKVKVTLICHGESYYNRYRDIPGYEGSKDCHLTMKGRQQSRKLEGEYHLIILSPLKRCIETLLESNLRAPNLEYCNLVRENRLNLCDFLEHEEKIIESEEQILQRVKKFNRLLEKLKKKNPKMRTIAIITHANFIWYLTSKIHQPTGWRMGIWLENCKTYDYEY